jgi:UDP:flavonoid glycosyltransferase YjiC (YdhE family)
VISHGGAGTVLGAAAHGRPQLVIPLFADQRDSAVAVRDAGCGLLVHPNRRSAADIEAALRILLDDSTHRDAADASPARSAIGPLAGNYSQSTHLAVYQPARSQPPATAARPMEGHRS